MKELKQLLLEQRVIILVGSGGVGKTTTAIATAFAAAILGKKVALISIDPAKRLASALGIPLGGELKKIHFDETHGVKGEVHAAMLEQKTVFDQMVRKHAPSPHIADKILRDPLYISASTNLSGPLEHMALAKLQELVEDPNYDLVVVDTPPDTHALDFLKRPNVLANFLEQNVITKLLKPAVTLSKFGLSKVFSASEKILGGVSSLTGFAALARFGEFIVLMQQVIEGFNKAGERVVITLKQPSTSFFLVTTPTAASARSSIFFAEKLKELGYKLDALIFNKSLSATAKQAAGKTSLVLKSREEGEKKVMDYVLQAIEELSDADVVIVQRQETDESLCDVESMLKFARG